MAIESAADFNSYVDNQIGGVSATFFEAQNTKHKKWKHVYILSHTVAIQQVKIKTKIKAISIGIK